MFKKHWTTLNVCLILTEKLCQWTLAFQQHKPEITEINFSTFWLLVNSFSLFSYPSHAIIPSQTSHSKFALVPRQGQGPSTQSSGRQESWKSPVWHLQCFPQDFYTALMCGEHKHMKYRAHCSATSSRSLLACFWVQYWSTIICM